MTYYQWLGLLLIAVAITVANSLTLDNPWFGGLGIGTMILGACGMLIEIQES